MSKGRMIDLTNALEGDGWEFLNPESLFEVENEVVHWIIEHRKSATKLHLDFHIFGELGERSDSLVDILYCVVGGTPIKLYFEKRESQKWKQSVSDFVASLEKVNASH